VVGGDAGPRENLAEELEHRLTAESRRRDRLSGVALELLGRPRAIEWDRVEPKAILGIGEDQVGEAFGRVGVAVHGASLIAPTKKGAPRPKPEAPDFPAPCYD